MKNIYLIGFIILLSTQSWGQCTLNLISSVDSLLCGDCATLSAFGSMDGNVAFEEDFNSGSPTGWQFTQSTTIANNTCGVPAPDGSDFMWMGDQAVNPRDMTTVSLDLSPGGVICFEMRFAVQGDASPCEGPDENDEGVALQYSTDNGATWIDIQYWNPNGGNDPTLTAWNQYCVNIPAGAMTNNTLIQWHQDDVSGAEYDHWGIDNVQITLNDPTSQITWLHDNYNYPQGSSGGDNPTDVCLTTETTFTAQITNGTNTCTETITIPVKTPILQVYAGTDTTICAGECVTLDAEAGVIVNQGGTKHYANNQPEDASGLIGMAAETNINVQNMNQQTLTSGSITSVCIDAFEASGTFLDPLDEGDFNVTLTTPDGCSIELVPENVANGQYNQVCFVPAGGGNINGGGFPASSTWAPNQPFTNLNGCSTNGTWTLTFQTSGSSIFGGSAELAGWSITFNDVDSLDSGIYTWAPTTNMNNPTSETPEVCPTATTTYTLTVVDSNACVTPISDDVTITVDNSCCNFDITAVTSAPTCGNSDGSIDLTIANGSGNYTYDWGANGTTEDLTMIGQGSYTCTITDVTAGCSKDTTFDFSTNTFSYTINTTIPSCGGADGGIEFVVTGTTPPYSYSIDNGANFVNTPNFTTLIEGTYNLSVQDVNGCQKDTLIELMAPSFDYTLTLSDPNCGGTDGSIVFSTTGGQAPFGFSIDNGVNNSLDSNFLNLSAGTYNLLIADATGCLKDSIVELTDIGSVGGTVSSVDLICNNDNSGRIVLSAVGGTSPFTYDIGNGPQNSAVFNNIAADTYNLTITDAAGCTFDTTVTLQEPPAMVITLNITDPTCYNTCDASVEASVSGGTISNMPSYQWSGALSTNTSNIVTDICLNNYTLTVIDDNACEQDTTFSFVAPVDIVADFSATPQPATMFNSNITLTEESLNGTIFTWFVDSTEVGYGSPYIHTFPDDTAGTYNVCLLVEDIIGCSDSICKDVVIDPDFIIFVPNTFTPNGDGDNDYFYAQGLGLELIDYELVVFNKWGDLIWTSSNAYPMWDGTYKGQECKTDTYIWNLKTKDQGSKDVIKLGHVNLIR